MGELIRADFTNRKVTAENASAQELRVLRLPSEASPEELIEQAANRLAMLDYAVYKQADEIEIQDLSLTSTEALSMVPTADWKAVYKRAASIQTQLMIKDKE